MEFVRYIKNLKNWIFNTRAKLHQLENKLSSRFVSDSVNKMSPKINMEALAGQNFYDETGAPLFCPWGESLNWKDLDPYFESADAMSEAIPSLTKARPSRGLREAEL